MEYIQVANNVTLVATPVMPKKVITATKKVVKITSKDTNVQALPYQTHMVIILPAGIKHQLQQIILLANIQLVQQT